MKQVSPKKISSGFKSVKERPKKKYVKRKYNKKQKYGTSKLEKLFATEFLEKNNLVFIYQYEAKDIKRFFDFALTANRDVDYAYEIKDGIKSVKQDGQHFTLDLLIEVDGSYYHSDPRVVKEEKIKPMHKHNKYVDKIKDRWAGMNCVPILRIWEYDIHNNPNFVLEELSKYVKIIDTKNKRKLNMKKPN